MIPFQRLFEVRGGFLTVPPDFQYQDGKKLQPISVAFSRIFRVKIYRWLSKSFNFGTESEEERLKQYICSNIKVC